MEAHDNRPGRFSGGLQALATSAKRFAQDTIGDEVYQAVSIRCVEPLFDTKVVFALTRKHCSCDGSHPQVCKNASKKLLARIQRLVKVVWNRARAFEERVGYWLCFVHGVGVEGGIFWLAHRKAQPKHAWFVTASPRGDWNDHSRSLVLPIDVGLAPPFGLFSNFKFALNLFNNVQVERLAVDLDNELFTRGHLA